MLLSVPYLLDYFHLGVLGVCHHIRPPEVHQVPRSEPEPFVTTTGRR